MILTQALKVGTVVIVRLLLWLLAAVCLVCGILTALVAVGVRYGWWRALARACARACDRARGTQARETTTPTRQYECRPPTDPKE